jgi:hypothetical protein
MRIRHRKASLFDKACLFLTQAPNAKLCDRKRIEQPSGYAGVREPKPLVGIPQVGVSVKKHHPKIMVGLGNQGHQGERNRVFSSDEDGHLAQRVKLPAKEPPVGLNHGFWVVRRKVWVPDFSRTNPCPDRRKAKLLVVAFQLLTGRENLSWGQCRPL